MTTIGGQLTVINSGTLYRGMPSFCPADHKLAAEAVQQAKGRVIGVVHPLFCQPNIHNPSLITDNRLMRPFITPQRYNAYLTKLTQFLRTSIEPLLVFIPEGRQAEIVAWVNELKRPGLAMTIATEAISPQPVFPNSDNPHIAWRRLTGMLMDIGVAEVIFVGEKYYRIASDRAGCVYSAFMMTHMTSRISVELIDTLTFPNVHILGYEEE